MECMMARIASDDRKTWVNGVPSDATVGAFRARYPNIYYRVHTRKNAAKLRAEDPAHLKSFTEY